MFVNFNYIKYVYIDYQENIKIATNLVYIAMVAKALLGIYYNLSYRVKEVFFRRCANTKILYILEHLQWLTFFCHIGFSFNKN